MGGEELCGGVAPVCPATNAVLVVLSPFAFRIVPHLMLDTGAWFSGSRSVPPGAALQWLQGSKQGNWNMYQNVMSSGSTG